MGSIQLYNQLVTLLLKCVERMRVAGMFKVFIDSLYFTSIFRDQIFLIHIVNRSRLEQYEQACAIDSSTLKCAGHPSGCRTAILGILGTPLRTTCSCHNTDLVYECLGWYRLLWLNTCVGKLPNFCGFYSIFLRETEKFRINDGVHFHYS